jgi:hypothetical protein
VSKCPQRISSLSAQERDVTCPIKRIIERPTFGMIKNVKLLGKPLGMLLMRA